MTRRQKIIIIAFVFDVVISVIFMAPFMYFVVQFVEGDWPRVVVMLSAAWLTIYPIAIKANRESKTEMLDEGDDE